MSHVVLIGCGNIGFRHLQALLATSEFADINLTVVEPNDAHHARIRAELVSSMVESFKIETRLPNKGPLIDLAIVATSANVRREVVDTLLENRTVKVAILEKVLFQRLADLEAVAASLDANGTKAYVNCGRRGFPGYQRLAADLETEGPVHLTVTGQQYALASNGIHFLDLAEFLNRSPLISLDGSDLNAGTLPSKRDGFVEVTGTLKGRLANGAEIRLLCEVGDRFDLSVGIQTKRRHAEIDELKKTMTWQDGVIEDFETRHVSEMPHIYETVLLGKTCALTSYSDSCRQHRFFLTTLLKHMGVAADGVCAIS